MSRPRFLLLCAAEERLLRVPPVAAGLRLCWEVRGARLYVGHRMPAQCLNGLAVIGTIFDRRSQDPRPGLLGPVEAGQVAASSGASLMADWWGAYVAIAREPVGGATLVVRDPSGGVPCYFAHGGGLLAIASEVDDLLASGAATGAVDLESVGRHLLFEHLREPRTCLQGVSELVPGQMIAASGADFRLSTVWTPTSFARSEHAVHSPAVASTQVRDSVMQSVKAWSNVYGHPLLALSGGLDSSIVAAALGSFDRDFECVTLVTSDAGGDERPFATAMADRLGRRLTSRELRVEAVDLSRSAAAHLPRPTARAFAQAGDRELVDVAEKLRCDAFFSGGGGDNVFCLMGSAAPVTDRFRSGAFLGTLSTAGDLARLRNVSLWGVLKAASRVPRNGYLWPRNPNLLAPDMVAAATDAHHPWLRGAEHLAPGKARHVAWILGIQNHLEGFERELHAPIVSPLLSQPVVEACLRIPTWLWCEGGVDRAVARSAFSDLLPLSILSRTGKGSPGSFVIEVLEANRTWLTEFLGDGLLAREGMIDVPRVMRLLRTSAPFRSDTYSRLAALADVEAWLRARADRSRGFLRAGLETA